ncbi:MAG: DNA-processing protein DprA [Phycisphaerae bacterium]
MAGPYRGGGRTIAVLGNGLASVYPLEHTALASEIANAGAIVSELPPDVAPEAKNFPRRNRIIIGLALGVIVVEAGYRSGALITARLASEYNREVFAIPGRVDQPDYSAGVNGLIRDGHAKLITCLEDVLDELGDTGTIMGRLGNDSTCDSTENEDAPPASTLPLDGAEQAVYEAVAGGLDEADLICSATGLDVARVTSALTSLELRGLVSALPGKRFVQRRTTRSR